jgi:glycosyltransferase involved in cell wall biosynthesis
MICYIPSTGRSKTKTYKLFENAGIKVIHFIEPKEYNDYNVPNKVNIQKDNQGISYVRNFMLNYAKENDEEWVVFCDDDVTGFGIYNGKTIKIGAEIWWRLLEKAKQLPFELIGINYAQHAWHEKDAYSINKKYVEVCVLMNVKKIKWNYVKGMKQDRQFCFETIRNGYGVLKFNHFWFRCPDVGTNKGGLYNEYKNKDDVKAAERLVQTYYPYAKLIKKKDRIEAKLDIKGFAKHLNKIVK